MDHMTGAYYWRSMLSPSPSIAGLVPICDKGWKTPNQMETYIYVAMPSCPTGSHKFRPHQHYHSRPRSSVAHSLLTLSRFGYKNQLLTCVANNQWTTRFKIQCISSTGQNQQNPKQAPTPVHSIYILTRLVLLDSDEQPVVLRSDIFE
jgi:hypothetical protein